MPHNAPKKRKGGAVRKTIDLGGPEKLSNAVKDVFSPPTPVTDEHLNRLAAMIEEEERLRDLVRLAAPRDPQSYDYTWLENLKVRFYERRYDRILWILFGIAALGLGAFEILWPERLGLSEMTAAISALLGTLLIATSVQAARAGYLDQRNLNYIQDLAAALPATIIRGHHAVHQAESDLLQNARSARARRVLIADMWFRERQRDETVQFEQLRMQEERYASEKDAFGGELLIATSATKWDIDKCSSLMEKRLGKAKQLFFFDNPFQLDAILSQDEVILSFVRRSSHRDFALRFRNSAVVSELWDIIESQLTERSDIESTLVVNQRDVENIQSRVSESEAGTHQPHTWDD